MIDLLYIALITSTALLMGNEFSIACFIHPSLAKADHQRFIPAIQVFAKLFGAIMQFWMAGTLVLHLILTWMTWSSHPTAGSLTLYAAFLWMFVVVFSVIFPVPINNRVGRWNPSDLPANWRSERKIWDIYNAVRVLMIGIAFVVLLIAYKRTAG